LHGRRGPLRRGAPQSQEAADRSATIPQTDFTQLIRHACNAQDKQAALKLVRSLAGRLSQARERIFALARAAVNAGDERVGARGSPPGRTAAAGLEPAVLLEAQLLQKASADQAASLLAAI